MAKPQARGALLSLPGGVLQSGRERLQFLELRKLDDRGSHAFTQVNADRSRGIYLADNRYELGCRATF